MLQGKKKSNKDWKEEIKLLLDDDVIIYPPKIQPLELMKESASIFRYKTCEGTLLVIQWLRICLPMQGTQVQSLVWEDPPCCEAAKLACHSH